MVVDIRDGGPGTMYTESLKVQNGGTGLAEGFLDASIHI